MATEFNLPGSSFEEIQKIIKGYSHSPENVSLDSLSKLTGLNPTVISRNNKFLTDIGLISGGMKKTATDIGKKLGRAIEHNQESDISSYWKEAIQSNEKVAGLVTTIRIKGGMSERDFINHVLYVSGQKNGSRNKTGSRCIVDVLLEARLIKEQDGKLSIGTPPPVLDSSDLDYEHQGTNAKDEIRSSSQGKNTVPNAHIQSQSGIPQLAINIQLHLPETENSEVYEKLFKALRENLLSPKE